MDREEAVKNALEVVEESVFVTLGTNGGDGYPNMKAMFKMENEGLKRVWLSTNTSSKRVAQLLKDPRACLYFSINGEFKGVMLVGDMEVLQDEESRRRIWNEQSIMYYPKGVNDPDYTVLRFNAKWGNYYHGLSNLSFEI